MELVPLMSGNVILPCHEKHGNSNAQMVHTSISQVNQN